MKNKIRQAEIAQSIGRVVRERRKARGWSQERLAREISMSRETVRSIEAGERIADWGTLELLADTNGVDLFELLGFEATRRYLRSRQPALLLEAA